MSSLPWNSPGATTCHCDSCDGPPSPACVVCRGDCIPLNDAGECAECEPREDETCEEWAARVRARKPKSGKHSTPGQWEAVGLAVYADTPNGSRLIVSAKNNTPDGTEEERLSNARLIAAAPELFAALWEIKVSDLDWKDCYEIARRAVLKVTGGAK